MENKRLTLENVQENFGINVNTNDILTTLNKKSSYFYK